MTLESGLQARTSTLTRCKLCQLRGSFPVTTLPQEVEEAVEGAVEGAEVEVEARLVVEVGEGLSEVEEAFKNEVVSVVVVGKSALINRTLAKVLNAPL
ncbi:MAG: uncharacterized protein KVP18_002368 [Porospora cf. gigantea A]|uniref:uncharacterized protein n=1 Tax=Porospora cf. gigantea A TaxID=2853593 RepID=UPI0035599FE3|nr:MAG: hypothetical protein KVP18_002368 [Porospora cf. gigantea A]